MTQPSTAGQYGHTGPVPADLWANPGFRADRLVTARRRLAMSQGELARRLGVDQSTVSRLERGEMQSPPWKLVVQACLHLKLEPHALMDVNSGPAETCRPLSLVRARISHHFLYLGNFSRMTVHLLAWIIHESAKTPRSDELESRWSAWDRVLAAMVVSC
jgi:transcriptional regulator with XRE-family HTH domain